MSDNQRSEAPAQGASADPAQARDNESETAQNTGGEGAPVSASPAEGPGAAETAAAQAPEGESQPPSPEERIAQLEAENAQLARDKQEHWDRLLRATADMDNLRKRGRRELDDARIDARSKVLREMLPVIDNLERAVEHAEGAGEGAAAASIIEGVKLVLRQFAQALERCDVAPVDAVGKPFDPALHEAISQMETSEQPPGSVVQALQKGYTIGNRLLRPSLVVVAKAPAEPPPGSAGPNGGDPEPPAAEPEASGGGDTPGGEA